MAVRLRLLGSPALEREGEVHPLPFERRSQLLAYLALKGAWVGRAELAALFWPDQDTKLAYTNLRKTLFRLRSLPWAPDVQVQHGALRFDAETDVAALERALREGRVAEAASLKRGELLAAFDDDASEAWSSWLAFERERIGTAWRASVLRHFEGDIEPNEGVELSARLLEADPLDESALRAHMGFLARDGKPAQAREAYREFVARLADDLGLAPPTDLAAFHDALAAGPLSPPARAPAAEDDGFIGRSVELRQLAALLGQPDCRLVTLVGPGGVGKTRLARRALRELGAGYRDGAAFVALEDAASAADIASRIAGELQVVLARRDPADEIAEFLRGRALLLVLDNFEHLAGEAAMLGAILERCPAVDLVVTSRARLGLPHEQLLPLEGLPAPDPEDHDRFEAFDAVRLFVKAARRVEPGLVPEAEATAIVEICRQVDGLPLAIELAASWARVLSCEAIAAQLRDGLQLLRAADGTRPARHASMQVVFENSWRLLGDAERDALVRLSVFEGGFAPESARAVAQASLPVVAALVDKSLLRKEGARLHLHPLLHQMAAAQLQHAGLEAEARRAHAQHFHRLMAQLRENVREGDVKALATLEREFSNCRGAWRWAAAHGPASAIAGSVFTLLYFCDHRFRLEEGLALLGEAMASPAAAAHREHVALLTAVASHLQYRLDRYPQAEADALRALATTQPGSDAETRLQCFKVLGGCCLRVGRLPEARHWFKEALREATRTSNPTTAAGMLDNLALVEKSLGNYDEALRLSQQSLVQYRLLRNPAGEALSLNNLGTLCVDRREYDAARVHLAESLALCQRHGLTNTGAMADANLLELEVNTGNLEAAARHGQRAMEVARSTGSVGVESWIRLQMARLAVRQGDLAAARGQLAAGIEIAIAISRTNLQFTALSCFAELLEAQGDAAAARAVLGFAVAHPEIRAQESDPMRARLAALPSAPPPGGLALALDDLLHRIVVERDLAHQPLRALLGRQAAMA